MSLSLTAPKDAEVKVAQKIGSRHYVPFTYYDPATAVESGNDMVYTYRLPKSPNYNYRVSRPQHHQCRYLLTRQKVTSLSQTPNSTPIRQTIIIMTWQPTAATTMPTYISTSIRRASPHAA